MRKRSEKVMDILADILARFIMGFAGSFAFLFCTLRIAYRVYDWRPIFLLAGAVGLLFAIFGLRKGPGVI